MCFLLSGYHRRDHGRFLVLLVRCWPVLGDRCERLYLLRRGMVPTDSWIIRVRGLPRGHLLDDHRRISVGYLRPVQCGLLLVDHRRYLQPVRSVHRW